MEVVNVRVNDNGVLLNPSEVVSYIDELGINLNTKEYLSNLNQFLIFNIDLKNHRDVLIASSDKLKECIAKELENENQLENHASIFPEEVVRSRY